MNHEPTDGQILAKLATQLPDVSKLTKAWPTKSEMSETAYDQRRQELGRQAEEVQRKYTPNRGGLLEGVQMFQQSLIALEMQAHDYGLGYDFVVMAVKRQVVIACLERNKGNQCKAARDLRIHRNTIGRIMDELKISHRTGRERA